MLIARIAVGVLLGVVVIVVCCTAPPATVPAPRAVALLAVREAAASLPGTPHRTAVAIQEIKQVRGQHGRVKLITPLAASLAALLTTRPVLCRGCVPSRLVISTQLLQPHVLGLVVRRLLLLLLVTRLCLNCLLEQLLQGGTTSTGSTSTSGSTSSSRSCHLLLLLLFILLLHAQHLPEQVQLLVSRQPSAGQLRHQHSKQLILRQLTTTSTTCLLLGLSTTTTTTACLLLLLGLLAQLNDRVHGEGQAPGVELASLARRVSSSTSSGCCAGGCCCRGGTAGGWLCCCSGTLEGQAAAKTTTQSQRSTCRGSWLTRKRCNLLAVVGLLQLQLLLLLLLQLLWLQLL